MRNLIIIAGSDTSGKAEYIRTLGLDDWVVDYQAFHRLYATPKLQADGTLSKESGSQRKIISLFLMAIKDKISWSEPIVVALPADQLSKPSGHHNLARDLLALASRHRYTVSLVDLDDPDDLTTRLSQLKQDLPFKLKARTYSRDTFGAHLSQLIDNTTDISDCDAIIALGDIHANADALEKCLAQAEGKGRFAYIFTGDYISKGPHPARTLRLLRDFALRNEHSYLAVGNHEMLLEEWAYHQGSGRPGFSEQNLVDMTRAQYSRRAARQFLDLTADHQSLHWRGYDITVTHGGISCHTGRLGLLSGIGKRNGTGDAHTDIDRLWERNCRDHSKLQIHGHRNLHRIEAADATSSFNLEGIDAFRRLSGIFLRTGPDGLACKGFSVPICPTTRTNRKSSS